MRSLELIRFFDRALPDDLVYLQRLELELGLIEEMGYTDLFKRVTEVIGILKESGIPFITRGSAGSSLVSYLLGISDIDPIKEDISITRFLNPLRQKMPDYDIDVPHTFQREIHQRVHEKWPGQSARISNHLHFREKSALRQAIRNSGHRKFLPRGFSLGDLFSPDQIEEIRRQSQKLLGKPRGISLHCGGVVFFDDGIPKEYQVGENQVNLDKRDIERLGLLKVDLLSNRGLSELHDLSSKPIAEYPEWDEATCALLRRGATIGITQAESPAFRKMLRALEPRCRQDMILAMGLIRPAAASRGRKSAFFEDWGKDRSSELPVFEDQVNSLVAKLLSCPEREADIIRRGFAKGNQDIIQAFSERLAEHPKKKSIMDDLSQFKEYSLCKAHGVSYGRMAWALAYQKAHQPQKFWCAALNNCQSMYERWVYIEGAKAAGLKVLPGRGPWMLDGDLLRPVVHQGSLWKESPQEELNKYGFWSEDVDFPGTYWEDSAEGVSFSGLIATGRRIKKDEDEWVTFLTVGTSGKRLVDLVLPDRVGFHRNMLISGTGFKKRAYNSEWIEVQDYRLRSA